jgi:tetratricopeptide (TPR) repeat protein
VKRALAALFIGALALAAVTAQAGPMENTQANIHFNLALRQYQAQKLDDAADSLSKALTLVPDHPQANLLLGIIDCQESHFDKAIAPLKLAAAGLPDNPDPWNNLGVAYFQLGRTDEAADAFSQVLRLKPDSPEVAMNLGVLRLRQKKYLEARKAFLAATAADKTNTKAWLGLAEAADGSGDTGNAILARQTVLSLQDGDNTLRMELGQRLYEAGRLSEAAQALAPLQGSGQPEAEFLLGVLDYRQGDFDDSRQRFEAALAARPDYPEARYNLAITDYDQGLYPDALAQFQAVLDKHGDDEEARKNLDVTRQAAVHAWLKQGSEDFLKADYVAALDHWRKALGLDNGNKVVKDLVDTAQAQLKLQADDLAGAGKQAWDGGTHEEAIRDWAQALERDPDNAAAKAGLNGAKDEVGRLVEAYQAQAKSDLSDGRLDRAREQAARVLALDKSQGKKLNDAVETECRSRYRAALGAAAVAGAKGAFGAQVDALELAVEAEPGEGATQLNLNRAKVALRQALDAALDAGQKAEKAGHVEEAVKQFRRVLELQAANATAKQALGRLASKAKARGMDAAQLDDLYYQGVYAYAGGDVKKAENFWKKVLAIDPHHSLAKEALERSQKRSKALQRN